MNRCNQLEIQEVLKWLESTFRSLKIFLELVLCLYNEISSSFSGFLCFILIREYQLSVKIPAHVSYRGALVTLHIQSSAKHVKESHGESKVLFSAFPFIIVWWYLLLLTVEGKINRDWVHLNTRLWLPLWIVFHSVSLNRWGRMHCICCRSLFNWFEAQE